MASTHFPDLYQLFGAKTPALLSANLIAEYLLVIELTAGRCALGQTRDKTGNEADTVWREMGSELQNLHVQMLSEFADIPADKAKTFLDTAIDWQRYGRQMQFFMTEEKDASILDKKIPDDVYAPDVDITIEHDFTPETFGPYKNDSFLTAMPFMRIGSNSNSSFNPLLESEKARFVTATFALLLEQWDGRPHP